VSTVDRYLAPHVLTQDADERWLSPGVVDVADGRIAAVGSPQDVPDRPYARVHQLSGMLLPGFVNAHAHSPMVLLRGAGEGLPVGRWLTEVIWPREGRLSPDDISWGMRLGAAELLAGGVTTSCEMYFRPRVMAEAAREAGLRCLIAPPLLVSEGPNALGTWEQQLQTAAAFATDHRDDPLIQGVIGPHAAYTVPEAPMREAGRVAAAEGLLLHLHVAEAEREGDAIRERYRVSVPRYLERLGVLEARVLAAHGVWLDHDDIAIFAEHDVAVAHCPNSNGKHASGLAPVTALRAAGSPSRSRRTVPPRTIGWMCSPRCGPPSAWPACGNATRRSWARSRPFAWSPSRPRGPSVATTSEPSRWAVARTWCSSTPNRSVRSSSVRTCSPTWSGAALRRWSAPSGSRVARWWPMVR
jgi:5-methylthioadenosine/S-adenosylhomocysteine deaminase